MSDKVTVVCPRCSSENVKLLGQGLGGTTIAFFLAGSIFMMIGIIIWPLLILAIICAMLGVFFGFFAIVERITMLFSEKARERHEKAKWKWYCKKCHKTFTTVLQDSTEVK